MPPPTAVPAKVTFYAPALPPGASARPPPGLGGGCDAAMSVATVVTEPDRHALVMPGDCDCGLCTPTWARRRGKSRRYSEPVTLGNALRRENAGDRSRS